MKGEKNVSTFKRGDKLDLIFLLIATLTVSLLTLSNISIPAMSTVEGSKNGVTFFNLGSFSYYKELPLLPLFSFLLGAVSIGLIVLLMLRRKNKVVVSTKKRFILFIVLGAVVAFYSIAVLFLAPSAGIKETHIKLVGSDEVKNYLVSIESFTAIYRICYIVCFSSFAFYSYFILFYLRSFSYCIKGFIKYTNYLVMLIAIGFFLGVFFNTYCQDEMISNFNSLLGRSGLIEVNHPIISNSLLGFSMFIGCLSASILFYRKPNILVFILALAFAFATFITGNVYALPLSALTVTLTSILTLMNSKGRIKTAILSLILVIGLLALAILSVSILKTTFPTVYQTIRYYYHNLKTSLNEDIYLWKVTFSSIFFYRFVYAGLSPYIFTTVVYTSSSLLNVANSPAGSSNNMYIQTFGAFGIIGLLLIVLPYAFIVFKCFSMLKYKKKEGLFYFVFLLLIIFSSLFFNYGLFGYSPLSMMFTVIFVFPFSRDYNFGLISRGKNLAPGEIKEVEHKYVRYDVQADDISQNNNNARDNNISYKDAEYEENKHDSDELEKELNLPTRDDLDEEEKNKDKGAKKKYRDRDRRLVEKEEVLEEENLSDWNEGGGEEEEEEEEVVPTKHKKEKKEKKKKRKGKDIVEETLQPSTDNKTRGIELNQSNDNNIAVENNAVNTDSAVNNNVADNKNTAENFTADNNNVVNNNNAADNNNVAETNVVKENSTLNEVEIKSEEEQQINVPQSNSGISERRFDLNDKENIIPQEDVKKDIVKEEIKQVQTPTINRAPDLLILKELPTSIIKNNKIEEKGENLEDEPIRHDDELLAQVIERQTQYREEPIQAHYKKEEKKINTSMVNKTVNHPTGKVVNRRSDVDYENSYEIIENKVEKISEDNNIIKDKPKRILDYDEYNRQKKVNIDEIKKFERPNTHDTRTLYNFNTDKKATMEKNKISKNIDSILHDSTPPNKPIKTSAVVFDDLLNNQKLSSIKIDEFKDRDKQKRDEIQLQKKIEEAKNKEITINPEAVKKAGAFGSLLDKVKVNEPAAVNVDELKQNRKHYSIPKIRVIKEGEQVEKKRRESNFFDDLL